MFRRLSSALLTALIALPLVFGACTKVAHAEDTLQVTSTTTYTVDANTGVVHVLVDMQLKNLEFCSGRYLVYTSISLPIPVGASTPVAKLQDGKLFTVAVTPVADSDNYVQLEVFFNIPLDCRRTWGVTVTYDLLGNGPRAQDQLRINPAYSYFFAYGFGDDVTVKVIVPESFTSETVGDRVVEAHKNGNTVYTATDIADPIEFGFFVSATNEDALVTSDVATDDGVGFVLHTWPGDTEWQEFMTNEVKVGVPVLAELIGQPWPIDDTVDVRESHTPYVYGYAGWFSFDSNEIEIGEDLDADTALHELSHAWFSDEWFSDRWVNEGFAQVFASRGVEALGGDGLRPKTIVTSDPGTVRLNDWGDPSYAPTGEIDATEAYGYNACFQVLQQIADEIGDARLREVLDAVADDTIAYRGDARPEAAASVTDWRRFLDLVEEIGGATQAADLFEKYVVTETERSRLTDRATARDQYQELVADGGEWAAPLVVRERMGAWNFTKATDLIAAAHDVLTLRDELDAKVAQINTTYPEDIELLYEESDENLDDARAAVQQQIETADALLAAVKAKGKDFGLFGTIGLIGADLDKTLSDAKAAFADGDQVLAGELAQDVIDRTDDAFSAGKTRALLAGAILLVAGLGIALLVRRRRRAKQSADPSDATVVD